MSHREIEKQIRTPGWVTVCVEFAHSPRVCVGFLRVLRFPPTFPKDVQLVWWFPPSSNTSANVEQRDSETVILQAISLY